MAKINKSAKSKTELQRTERSGESASKIEMITRRALAIVKDICTERDCRSCQINKGSRCSFHANPRMWTKDDMGYMANQIAMRLSKTAQQEEEDNKVLNLRQ